MGWGLLENLKENEYQFRVILLGIMCSELMHPPLHSILINISRGSCYVGDLLPFGHLHLSFERSDGSIL
jgi:hypothetical protein